MFRIFKPAVFQGNLNRNSYFEGWYFKQVSADLNQVYAFIPGISLIKNDQHAFIQVINGITGQTDYHRYTLDAFSYERSKLFVRVGDSVFTDQFIDLNIDGKKGRIQGKIAFSGVTGYPSSLLAPGIMGWYSYVPFMECYHGVVSADHSLEGSLGIEGQNIDFSGGRGYIEKDWGKSFPESWIWLQSNSFEQTGQSIFLSIAKIPWLGRFFIGFIAFIYHKNRYYLFTTYNRSRIDWVKRTGNQLQIALSNRNHSLDIRVQVNNSGELVAPVRGKMDRLIKESIDSSVSFNLKNKDGSLDIRGSSPRAGLEIIEGIFDYL
jgi:hypothetical protein